MSISTRKIVAVLSASTLLGGAGLGVAQAASTASSSDSSSSSSSRHARPEHSPRLSTAQLQKIADTLGVSADQLQAAMDAARPAKPPKGEGKGDRGAAFAADLASALGVDAAKVKPILDANRPARPADGAKPAKGTPPDHTKLISALASGLSLDEATVNAAVDKLDAAHQAEHKDGPQAMFAAVAKQLGLSTDAVKAAFDANRPAPPAGAAARAAHR